MYKNQALYVYVQTAESGGAVRALFFCLELNDATGYYVLQYHSLSVPCLCFVHSGLGLGLTLSDRVVWYYFDIDTLFSPAPSAAVPGTCLF